MHVNFNIWTICENTKHETVVNDVKNDQVRETHEIVMNTAKTSM